MVNDMSKERQGRGRVLVGKHENVQRGRFILFHDATDKPVGENVSTNDMHIIFDGRATRAHRLFGMGIAKGLIEAGKNILFVFSAQQGPIRFPKNFPPSDDD